MSALSRARWAARARVEAATLRGRAPVPRPRLCRRPPTPALGRPPSLPSARCPAWPLPTARCSSLGGSHSLLAALAAEPALPFELGALLRSGTRAVETLGAAHLTHREVRGSRTLRAPRAPRTARTARRAPRAARAASAAASGGPSRLVRPAMPCAEGGGGRREAQRSGWRAHARPPLPSALCAQALVLSCSAALLAAMAATGALAAAEMDAVGAARAAALLLGELARAHGVEWQRAGDVAVPLSQALLASTRLLDAASAAVGSGGGAAGTTAAVLRAVVGIHPVAAGEAGKAVRHSQRVAEGALLRRAAALPSSGSPGDDDDAADDYRQH